MIKINDQDILTEHVLEVRHVASGSFLNVRGYIADYIQSENILPHWKIDANIINFRDKEDKIVKEGAFSGYKNTGYIVFNPETKNYFQDKAIKFWNTLIKCEFYPATQLNRFGTRLKTFIPSNQNFDAINKKLHDSLLTDQSKELFKGTKKDFQLILDMEDKNFSIKIQIGPIHEDEVGKYLNFDSDYFEKCGIFLDIDVFKVKDLNHKDIPGLLKEAVKVQWNQVNQIVQYMDI